MNTCSLNIAIAIVIIFGFVPTHEIKFPEVKKANGCARIDDTVPQPKLEGQLWRVTQWMKNRRRPFRCIKDDFDNNDSLATDQNVFLATDNANYAIKLICLAGDDSSEEKDGQHYYLVHTYANTPTPSPEIMKQILKAHVKHGLDLKWLSICTKSENTFKKYLKYIYNQ